MCMHTPGEPGGSGTQGSHLGARHSCDLSHSLPMRAPWEGRACSGLERKLPFWKASRAWRAEDTLCLVIAAIFIFPAFAVLWGRVVIWGISMGFPEVCVAMWLPGPTPSTRAFGRGGSVLQAPAQALAAPAWEGRREPPHCPAPQIRMTGSFLEAEFYHHPTLDSCSPSASMCLS